MRLYILICNYVFYIYIIKKFKLVNKTVNNLTIKLLAIKFKYLKLDFIAVKLVGINIK